MSDDDKKVLSKEEKIKQLNRIVCICKGIPLKDMLAAIKSSDTVEEVNRKTGSGSGGCRGERCGPRIRVLLSKKRKK